MRPSLPAMVILAALTCSLLSAPQRARALDLDRCVEVLDDPEVTGRLEWLERLFHRAEKRARPWFWGWLSLHAAVAGAGFALFAFENDPLRRDAYAIVAASSGASIVLLLAPPLQSASLSRRFRRMPDTTLAQRREKLDRSVALLRRAAAQEEQSRAWYRHAFAATIATSEAFFLGVRHRGRPSASILSGLSTLGLLEAQILTAPRGALRAAIDYEYGSRPCMAPQMRDDPRPAFELVSAPGGLGLGVRW